MNTKWIDKAFQYLDPFHDDHLDSGDWFVLSMLCWLTELDILVWASWLVPKLEALVVGWLYDAYFWSEPYFTYLEHFIPQQKF